MSFSILVDSTCDFSLDELKDINVRMVPLTITVDGDSYLDQVEISPAEFYERMASADELPKTAQPSPADFIKVYKEEIEKGADGIMVMCIAHVLSGTVGSARLAAGELDFPIKVIDSAGASAQCAVLVQDAVALRDAGKTLEETAEAIERRIPDSKFYIAPETLENLLKGGRLAQEDADNATKLNIKPIFSFDETGHLKPWGKARGMNGVRKTFVAEVEKRTQELGRQRVRICHAGNEAEAEKLAQALAESGIDYEDGGMFYCGATVGTHLGAGALGIGVITVA